MTKSIQKLHAIGALALIMMLSASTMALARENEPNDDRGGNRSSVAQVVAQNDLLRQDGSITRLAVEPNGRFSASGLVVNSTSLTVANGLSNGTLNVRLFGINFTIRANNIRIEGGSTTSTVVEVANGDRLSIQGTIDPGTGAITAERIVDHTLIARQTGSLQTRIADLLRLVEQLREQLRQMGR